MNKYVLLFISAFVLLFYSSCLQDHPNELDVKKEVIISAYIESTSQPNKAKTRAVDASWMSGDAIGVFMKDAGNVLSDQALAENVKFTTDGSSVFSCASADKIYFPFNKGNVDFISYYPYSDSLDGLKYNVDVSNQDSQESIDLLYSNNIKDVNSDNVAINLNFAHQLTKLVLNISENNTGKDLNNFSAKITNVNTNATFSLVDGSLNITSAPIDVSFNLNVTGNIAEAIVLPDNDLTNKALVITIDGTTYTYDLSKSTTITSFEKTKKCEYNITLKTGQGPTLEGVTATITDWATVSENITADEVPSTEGTSSATSNEDDITPTEGDTNKPREEAPEEYFEGDGSKETPYNITQALQLNAMNKVWIKGYVVGIYKNSKEDSFIGAVSGGREFTLALAFSPEETDFEKIFPVDFTETNSDALVNKLKLWNNTSIFKKEIYLKGNIGFWYTHTATLGLLAPTNAIIDGVEY
jgi:hypothetical protein